jgi:hypothetical protein
MYVRSWESLPDPEAPAPKSEPGLSNLFDEIRVTVGQEAQIITAVFPNPAVVMQVFLQRVFAQVVRPPLSNFARKLTSLQIQAYIETLITTASSSSTLAHLRILRLARSSTISLVDDLKGHDFFRTTSSSSTGNVPSLTSPLGASFGSTLSSQITIPSPATPGIPGAGGVGVAAVSAMLDQAMDELFVPYMEGTRYLDKEGKSLTELYAGKLLRFTNWHVSRPLSPPSSSLTTSSQRAMNKAKPSNTIFDRMVNQLTTAAHQAAQNTKELVAVDLTPSSSGLDRLMKLSGMGALSKEKIEDGEKLWEEGDGGLDLGVAEGMLKWHAEAVGRMVELSAAGDV